MSPQFARPERQPSFAARFPLTSGIPMVRIRQLTAGSHVEGLPAGRVEGLPAGPVGAHSALPLVHKGDRQ
jgi:hypothetical protein